MEKSWLLASDKIFSVMSVLVIIFGVVITYLVMLSRKASAMEKRMDELDANKK